VELLVADLVASRYRRRADPRFMRPWVSCDLQMPTLKITPHLVPRVLPAWLSSFALRLERGFNVGTDVLV